MARAAAFNAMIRGQQPTTHAHEWLAGIVALVPKILGALDITDNRPIVRICASLLGYKECLANHRVIFIVLEAEGFSAADIDLIRRLYYESFLSIGNFRGGRHVS